jgi:hypothetical protein
MGMVSFSLSAVFGFVALLFQLAQLTQRLSTGAAPLSAGTVGQHAVFFISK